MPFDLILKEGQGIGMDNPDYLLRSAVAAVVAALLLWVVMLTWLVW